jgi:hypothetical protein
MASISTFSVGVLFLLLLGLAVVVVEDLLRPSGTGAGVEAMSGNDDASSSVDAARTVVRRLQTIGGCHLFKI